MARQRAPQPQRNLPMTPEDLKAWKVRMGYTTNREAADALCLALKSFENVLQGHAPVSKRTAKMVAEIEGRKTPAT